MMKKVFLMTAVILTFCTTIASAQTKQGDWFSSSSIGASLSNFAGDIEDAKSRFGFAINTEIGYNVTDWYAPTIGLTNTYHGAGY